MVFLAHELPTAWAKKGCGDDAVSVMEAVAARALASDVRVTAIGVVDRAHCARRYDDGGIGHSTGTRLLARLHDRGLGDRHGGADRITGWRSGLGATSLTPRRTRARRIRGRPFVGGAARMFPACGNPGYVKFSIRVHDVCLGSAMWR